MNPQLTVAPEGKVPVGEEALEREIEGALVQHIEEDGLTIGLLLCKSKNKVVAEYALRNTTSPMGVADYQLLDALPKDLEANLPSIELLERELGQPLANETSLDDAEEGAER